MNVMIASPLEPELVDRVRKVPEVSSVLYDPALLPPPRYVCDHGGDPAFVRDGAQSFRWGEMLAQADAIFGYPGETPDGLAEALRTGPRIRFVQGTSAGMGAHVKRAALPADVLARVTFCSAAGVHAGMLAEFAFYGLLTIRKDARKLATIREQRAWQHYAMGELDGSTIAIVGMGQIGRAIAKRARAFGMRVLGVARTAEPQSEADTTYGIDQLRDVLPLADAVVVTLPITERTRGLIDAALIAGLKSSAVFVNVGRGGVADQDALVDALAHDRIAGAVLDVFPTEPLPAGSPLWTMPNVVLSPHTAALSVHENARITELLCDNVGRFVRGERLRNVVNLREFY